MAWRLVPLGHAILASVRRGAAGKAALFFRVVAALVVALLGPHDAAAQPASSAANLVSDPAPLRVEIKGRPYALEAMVLRRPGTDKLPVALITHGALPGDPWAVGIGSIKP